MLKKGLDFAFSIAKDLAKFSNGNLSVNEKGRGKLSRKILLRNLSYLSTFP